MRYHFNYDKLKEKFDVWSLYHREYIVGFIIGLILGIVLF